jgi:hypothetical protein
MKKQTILGLAAAVSMATPAMADTSYGWSLNSVTVKGRLVQSNIPIVYSEGNTDFVFSKVSTSDILKGALDSNNISGYSLVELISNSSSYGFFAYNKKTGNAVAIPTYWLAYDISGDTYSVSRYRSVSKGEFYRYIAEAFVNTYDVNLYGGTGFSAATASFSYDSNGKYKLSYEGQLYIHTYTYDTYAPSYQGLIDGTIKSEHSKSYASYDEIPASIRSIIED